MNLTDFTFAIGELCLYYAMIGPVFQMFGCSSAFLPQAAILLITEVLCASASRLKNLLRYLPLLLILPALLIGHSIGLAMLGAPAAIVLVLRTKAGSFRADNNIVHSLFLPSLGFYGFITFVAVIAGKTAVLVQTSLPLYTVWLLCAVLCMRLLRIPEEKPSLRFRLLNTGLLLLIAAVGLVLSSTPVTTAAVAAMRAVYLYFIAPVLFIALCIIAAVPAGLIYGLVKLLMLFRAQDTTEAEEQAAAEVQQVLQETGVDRLITPEWLIRCAEALGILLFLFIAYLLVRKLVSPGRAASSSGSYMRRETVAMKGPTKRHEGLFSAGTEDSIRKCYRKYLALCRSCRVPTDGTLASDAVLHEAMTHTGAADAEELRRLWLPVRYGSKASSPEDLKKARAALQAIRTHAAEQEKALQKQHRT